MKVKKKLKKDGPESLRRKVIHVAESWFMSESVISCRKVHFHVISRGCTKPDMNMHFGDMKLQLPTWKGLHNQNNFMPRKCKSHVVEKVDFSDDNWCTLHIQAKHTNHTSCLGQSPNTPLGKWWRLPQSIPEVVESNLGITLRWYMLSCQLSPRLRLWFSKPLLCVSQTPIETK